MMCEPVSDDLPILAPPARFLESAASLGIAFEPGEPEQLGHFLALLLDANRRFNLTAITDPDEAWQRHILDSMSLLPVITSISDNAGTPSDGDTPEGSPAGTSSAPRRIADVGSGGGLPAIPLAILMPQTQFVLIEATGKKARFLEDTVAALNLTNVRIVCDRAETLGHDRAEFRERFDLVTARAVGPLPVLLELTTPLLQPRGCLLAIKGERAGEELAASTAALLALHCVHETSLRTPTGTIVVIRKGARTPRQFPRKPGEPKRAPLGSQ